MSEVPLPVTDCSLTTHVNAPAGWVAETFETLPDLFESRQSSCTSATGGVGGGGGALPRGPSSRFWSRPVTSQSKCVVIFVQVGNSRISILIT